MEDLYGGINSWNNDSLMKMNDTYRIPDKNNCKFPPDIKMKQWFSFSDSILVWLGTEILGLIWYGEVSLHIHVWDLVFVTQNLQC